MNIYEKLMHIQSELNCPKDQYNSFGKYKYRNTESILESLKPLLKKYKLIINISDDIVFIGDRHYIKSIAKLIDVESESKDQISSTAYAREADNQRGMDSSQLSGSTSSYARKYALNGLFAIDDTKDSDATNKGDTEPSKAYKPNVKGRGISEKQISRLYAIGKSKGKDADTIKSDVKQVFNKEIKDLSKAEYDRVVSGYEKLGD